MSTKSTILLTVRNEHWYLEGNAIYSEDAKTREAIVLEFDKIHKVETDEDGTRIIIEDDTELFNEILGKFGRKFGG